MFPRGRWTPLAIALAITVAACDDDSPTDPGTDPTPPAQPTIVSVTEQGSALVVTWNAVTDASAYDVQRQEAVSGASYATVGSNVAGTSYSDAEVLAGKTYNYQVIAKNAAGNSTASSSMSGALGLREAALSGTISGTRTLSADTTYTITGIVVVPDGAVLNIPAGTLLLGSTSVQPSALMVRQGGMLNSVGTADAPVVFTSANAPGDRRRGDWGGVVLNGRSLCNFPAGECVGEGASGPYGGTTLDDNSGKLVYTRVEYAGYEVSFGNELNAITLNGVGSGTEIHHVQAHFGSDDGIELFGGTVDIMYALVTGASDDSFDYSTGWQGRGQFWIVQQDPNDADNGFEVDGNEEDFDATPLTDPRIYNVTAIGKGMDGAGGTAGESTGGMLLRRGTGGEIYNAIVMGFGTVGVDIDNAETVGRLKVANSIVFGNATNFSGDSDGIDDEGIMLAAAWENRVTDPGLAAPFDRATPDFRPTAGSAALEGFATPPSDGWFVPVTFVGAVSPDGTPWYSGWTTTALN